MPYNIRQVIAIIMLYVLAYIYSLIIAPLYSKEKDGINRIHESCVYGCEICKHATKYRGNNYYIGTSMLESDKKNITKCILTFWGCSHALLYALIGYIAPNLFIETFVLGVVFEIYEKYKFNCEDPLDILWNSLGFIIGAQINSHVGPMSYFK